MILTITQADVRLDTYVASQLDISRGLVQQLIKAGDILLNNRPTKASVKTTLGDVVAITLPEVQEADIVSEPLPLNILYEDEDLVVVNKAKGMVVHPAPGHTSGTLVNGLMHHCRHLSGINGVMRPGIVHRIDKDTSGILVVAKNDRTHTHLSEQLAAHTMTRSYAALAFGQLKEDTLTIDRPIGRNPHDRKKMAVTEKNSKFAKTHVTVMARYFYKNSWYSYVEARLETGRTHQIRVHLAHHLHPLVGDTVYGYQKQPWKTQGQVLHAKELGFIHPNGEAMHFTAVLPDYFEDILQVLNQ